MLGRNDTLVWPSWAHQTITNNRGRKKNLLPTEGHEHVRLWQTGSGSHTMDPDDSSTSWVVWDWLFAFSVSRDSGQWTVTAHQKRKGERVGDGHDSARRQDNETQTQLLHKLKVCKIAVPNLRDKVCQGKKMSNKETAAAVWERERQLLETTLL